MSRERLPRSGPRLRVGSDQLGLGQDVSLHRPLERRLARPAEVGKDACPGRTACESSDAARPAGTARRSPTASSHSAPPGCRPAAPVPPRPPASRRRSAAGCRAPSGPRSSSAPSDLARRGRRRSRPRLLVPLGGVDQAKGGEISSPSQVYRVGISPPGVKTGEVIVIVMGGAPSAAAPASAIASWLTRMATAHRRDKAAASAGCTARPGLIGHEPSAPRQTPKAA